MNIYKIIKEHIRRSIKNYKIYLVSILGMSIAITAAFHMYFFVAKEYSVDRFHNNKKDIYRVLETNKWNSSRITYQVMPLGETLKDEIPEIEEYIRIIKNAPFKLNHKNKKTEYYFNLVDPQFFNLLNFPLIKGSIEHFKETPNGVLLSEKKAKELFPDEDPIGKILTITKEQFRTKKVNTFSLQITGVIQDIPENSTLNGNYFINIDFYKIFDTDPSNVGWNSAQTELYLYIPNLKNKSELERKITQLKVENINSTRAKKYQVKIENYKNSLQRLDKIYLHSDDINEQEKKGSNRLLRILLMVVFLTLFLATTNYIIMNLGLNLNRLLEFKTKRYLGASKFDISKQLCIESLINVWFGFGITLASYPIFGKIFASVLNFNYQLSLSNNLDIIFIFLAIISTIGIVTGLFQYIIIYKAIFKTTTLKSSSKSTSIKVLICIQLFLFIGILSTTFLVKKQMSLLENKDLGYELKNVVSIVSGTKTKRIITLLEQKSYVIALSIGENLFRQKYNLNDIDILESNIKIKAALIQGDQDYLKVHSIQLLYGQNIQTDIQYSSSGFGHNKSKKEILEVIVNEEFVKKAHLKNPIGAIINDYLDYEIVGVFKNIYHTPLYSIPPPIILGSFKGRSAGYVHVLYNQNYKKEIYDEIAAFFKSQEIHEATYKNYILEFNFKEIYKKEMQFKSMLELFTIVVVIIAILGLISISLFITESRTKEVGVRKVNGATIKEILLLLNKEFVKWVLIAFIIATPISYYLMKNWLYNFAYKTTLSWWIFALSGIVVLTISLLAVSWQTYKSATQNPVKSLRDE